MLEPHIFEVSCERIPRRKFYYVKFPYNEQIIKRIKDLPEGTRKWLPSVVAWEVSTASLMELIKSYRGSDKIYFNFGNEDSRKVFKSQVIKIIEEEKERTRLIDQLNQNKENWLKYKLDLEETYVQHIDVMHKLLNDNIVLYPHQIVSALFMNATRNTLISHEMGLGKTLSSILYVEMNDFNKVVVITPNSLKFNYLGEVEKFTNSKAHIVNWGKNGKKNKYTIAESKYIILNYDYFNPGNHSNLVSKWEKLKIGQIDVLICDECFTYDTLITTSIGQLKIGDIVENKLDVKVLSYNHKLKKTELNSIVEYLSNGVKKVIKINLNDGKYIICTPNHKIYANDNYIQAKDLKYGDKLFILSENIQKEKIRTKILFNTMLNKIYRKRKRKKNTNNENKKWEYITNSCKNLSIMWKRVFYTRKDNKKILFNKLFCKMENESKRNNGESLHTGIKTENISSIDRKLQEQAGIENTFIKKNDIEESNASTKINRKNEKFLNWKNIFIKRWKWKINTTTNKIISRNIGIDKLCYGISNSNTEGIERNEFNGTIPTNTLQSRYWNTIKKISNRNRWCFSQDEKVEILRQKENRNIEHAWVESVEVLESGNRHEYDERNNDHQPTYNLEIENNHNYFANDILVSNCQKLKNSDSNTFKNFSKVFTDGIFINNIPSKIFLSGTPAPNRAHELYNIMHQISPLDFATKKYFQEYYCGMTYDFMTGWGYLTDTAEQKLEELYYKIAPYTHRKRKAEVLKDLPEKIYQKVMLEMDDDVYRTYLEVEDGVANEFVLNPTSNPLTIMIRLRQYTAVNKVNHILELIENILETGEKVVVVDFFKDSLYMLKEKLGDIAALHTGDQSVEERAEIVKRFQDPTSGLDVFLGSIQTCNYGLTLTAASKLLIITLPYSVGEYDQVSDRLHRIGQKFTVNIYAVMFRESIDEYVYSSIESKRKEITKVMDNEDYESTAGESVVSEVIQIIKNKHKR